MIKSKDSHELNLYCCKASCLDNKWNEFWKEKLFTDDFMYKFEWWIFVIKLVAYLVIML